MVEASAQEHALCDENRNEVRSVGAETFPFGGDAYARISEIHRKERPFVSI